MSNVEVRVGDINIPGLGDNPGMSRMCSNKLCYTTGVENWLVGGVHRVAQSDCMTPLKGRYGHQGILKSKYCVVIDLLPPRFVTIQKYFHADIDAHLMRIGEIEVVLYCGGENLPQLECLEEGDDDPSDCEMATKRGREQLWQLQQQRHAPRPDQQH